MQVFRESRGFAAPVLLVAAFIFLAGFVVIKAKMPELRWDTGNLLGLAQDSVPANDKAKGLIYDGLELSNDDTCNGGYKIKDKSGKAGCTHGPDSVFEGYSIDKKVKPISKVNEVNTVLGTTVACNGDGQSGKRVQVIYARSSDVADSYALYLPSLQQWVSGVDTLFSTSANQTGGTRNVRFVHDVSCTPVIDNVTLSAGGDDNFANTINELEAMGYNRTDRKYLIFVDAHVYCGISTMSFDDRPDSANMNNIGDTFGRIDAGCWSDVIPAHELGHQLGAVQMSAPHSSGETHCYDGYDNMCRPTNGTPLQILCPDTAVSNLFDCNDDDYYNTNPQAGSYLSTHWNSANNLFLIGGSGGTSPTPTPKGKGGGPKKTPRGQSN